MPGPAPGNTLCVDVTTDGPVDPTDPAAPASRTTDGRQRVLAALVVAAAALLVYSLSGGPWARAEVAGSSSAEASEASAAAQVELRLSGRIDVDPDGAAVADDLDASSPQRQLIDDSVGATTRDLIQVMAMLILVVAGVGVVLDLRSRLWGLLASASLVCLLAAAVLRDSATAALANGMSTLDVGPVGVDPTGWSALAIGAAATAALASFLATAERGVAARSTVPVVGPADDRTGEGTGRRRRPSTPAGRVRARLLNSLPSREG